MICNIHVLELDRCGNQKRVWQVSNIGEETYGNYNELTTSKLFFVRMYACMCVSAFVCLRVCLHVCLHLCVCVHIHGNMLFWRSDMIVLIRQAVSSGSIEIKP